MVFDLRDAVVSSTKSVYVLRRAESLVMIIPQCCKPDVWFINALAQ
jgi:hypothetical protein